MNRNILIAILAIIVIAAGGLMLFSHSGTTDGKINTEVNFLTGTTLYNGDQVQFELKDVQGNALAGENVTIAYDDGSGNIQNYSIFTDANGRGYLTISGEDAGSYNIKVIYDGNDQYNGCTGEQTITVEDGASEAQAAEPAESNSSANTVLYNNATSSDSTGSSDYSGSSNSTLHYDSEYNIYYDDNGIIRGGQNDGYPVDYIRGIYESGNMVDEDGNLQ